MASQQPVPSDSTSSTQTIELFTPGSILCQRYRIERELGHGGFAAVYLAHDELVYNKPVAIKVRNEKTTASDEWNLKKFREECEALARIDHPGVVSISDQGQTPEGRLFLVMQYVDGMTLRKVLKDGPMGLGRVAELINQIAQALGAAHDLGVCHRDLKPENIMLRTLGGTREAAVIIDFGLAGIEHSNAPDSDKTKIAGSLEYMAPEQLLGNPVTASDIYALGVIAYEMVTGRRPFPAQSHAELFLKQREGVQVKPIALRKDLPSAAQEVILRALSYESEQRYSRALNFGAALGTALAEPASRSASATSPTTDPNKVEMGFVLFMDLVGYSANVIEQQIGISEQLRKVVCATASYQRARSQGNLVSLPTGDGMALVFFGEPTAPVECAAEIFEALKDCPEIKLRMGVNTGPVSRIPDINEQKNVAGNGIDMAERVMSCGDSGHILVSQAVADVLRHLSKWTSYLHDLGNCKVKHGVVIHLFNLSGDGLGNARLPRKFQQIRRRIVAVAGLSLLGLGGAAVTIIKGFAPNAPKTSEPKTALTATSSPSTNRSLTYYLRVQRYRNGRPFRSPFQMSREMVVEPGDRIQFVVSSPQTGNLYLLNEGPVLDKGLPSFNILFPSPTANDGSSFLQAKQQLNFPPTISMKFDEEEGTEKFWMIWASKPLSLLEQLKEWANSRDQGSVKNLQQVLAIREFLSHQALATLEVDDLQKHSTLNQNADPLVYLIRFEHH